MPSRSSRVSLSDWPLRAHRQASGGRSEWQLHSGLADSAADVLAPPAITAINLARRLILSRSRPSLLMINVRGVCHGAAARIPRKPGGWSVALHRHRVAGRTPYDALHGSHGLHRLLFHDVLAGVAFRRSRH